MMTEICRLSESDEGDFKLEVENDFSDELKSFPHVLAFIRKLQEQIKRQKKKIEKLRNKLIKPKKDESSKTQIKVTDAAVQTELLERDKNSSESQDWDTILANNSSSIVDQVKEAAESALKQTGFVYEETTGLYYDYNSGYYYDATQGLYYDGNSGTYYIYNEESKSYQFHSQTQVTSNLAAVEHKKNKRTDKRKAQKANKDEAKKQKAAHHSDEKCRDAPEEGECSDSDNSENSKDASLSNESEIDDDQDLAKTYPPCMRIIVKETNLPKLKVGTLFLVAYTGGTMGREGDHSVIIPDLNISKHHARFQYDEDKKLYLIVDSGSRNGTILNGKRLSVAKQESDPCEVAHGSVIQLGGTKLLCHIHNGHETCGHCEPGLVQRTELLETNTTSKKDQYKTELRRLKNKFGVEKNNTETASQVATGYQDRAQARREHVGSSNHHVKTQMSSVETSIDKDNKGFKLLSKMGWSEGQSLGKDGSGRTEPIPMVNKQSKAGFGAPNPEVSTPQVDPQVEKKQKLWRKTQKRYKQLSD